MSGRLCAYLGLIKRNLVVKHQKEIKKILLWRQAANESKDGADWLLWRMDRLALAVKPKGGHDHEHGLNEGLIHGSL